METILSIFGLIALVAFVILAISGITLFNSLKKGVEDISGSVSKVSDSVVGFKIRLEKTLDEVTVMNTKLIQTIDSFSEMKEKLEDTIEHINDAATQIKATNNKLEARAEAVFGIFEPFEILFREFYNKIAPPVSQTGQLVSAAYKAVNAFTGFFHKK